MLLAWDDVVLSLKLDPAVHTALLDLPGAIGQASLALGMAPADPTGLVHSDPRFVRANVRERETWLDWLTAWIDLEGRAAVRTKLTRALPHLKSRFVRVNRFQTPAAHRGAKRRRRR